MDTEVTDAGPFERLITVQVPPTALAEAKKRVARKLSGEIKLKGFRPGKAPLPVVENAVGADRLKADALEDALPTILADALADADLRPVTNPRLEAQRDTDDGGVEVDLLITLWPEVDEIPNLTDRRITIDAPEVDDEEVQHQLDRFRAQYAELEDVNREGDEGDFVLVNITVLANGVEIEEAAASDLLYEIGSQSFIPGLDELLVGAAAGSIKEGPGTLPEGFGEHAGESVTLRVLVKGVRAKTLPDVTDEWVDDVSEFETVDELMTQLQDSILAYKRAAAGAAFQDQLIRELTDELDVEIPEALIDAEMEASFRNLAANMEAQKIELGSYLQITGQSEEEFVSDLKERADRALRTRVLLEAVASGENDDVSDQELSNEIAAIAESGGHDVEDVRTRLEESGQVALLTGDILRRKAMDRLLEGATPVDAGGNTIDLGLDDQPEPGDRKEEDRELVDEPVISADNKEADDEATDSDD